MPNYDMLVWHWLPEENPTFVTSELLAFFAA